MRKPYGKFPGRYSKAKANKGPRAPAGQTRIRFNGRYDLEQATVLFLRLIARMQDAEIASAERCAIYLTPLDCAGQRKTFAASSDGQETLELFLPISERFAIASKR